jgi:predicted RNase H-like nuclease (RuvC/YqgF family)
MAGRPTTYSEGVLANAQAYIDKSEDDLRVVGEGMNTKVVTQVKLPTIEGLARYLKISRSTLYLWQKEHEEFSDIIEELQQKQTESLINNGLSGSYNSTIAKVLLTKQGYTDKQEIDQKTEHSGSVAFTGINIIKPNEPSSSEEVHP